MTFAPPRLLGLSLGLLFLLVALAAVGLGVYQLGAAGLSPWVAAWIALPLLGVPVAGLVAYRLYGLITAAYHLDRDGFRLRWGLSVEQVPLGEVREVRLPKPEEGPLSPRPGLWWPGCVVGRREVAGLGLVEFFATTGPGGLLLVRAGDRLLALSPSDRQAFQQAYVDVIRMGSLEKIGSQSVRPDFFFGRLWADLWARSLILVGLVLPVLQLGLLALRGPAMPAQVPFGFDAFGKPDVLVPPSRLLLLPMIAGLCWLADFVLGIWLYRRQDQRPLSYGLWGTAIAVALLLWGASLQILTYSP